MKPRAVRALFDEHDRRVLDHRKPLWTLLVLELWPRAQLTPARHAGSAV